MTFRTSVLATSLVVIACGDDGGETPDAAAPDAALPGAACPVEGYQPCGGELAGTWSFAGLCPESPDDVPCENPFGDEPACTEAGNSQSCTLAAEGALTFDGANVRVERTLIVDATYVFTDACLAAVRTEPTPEERCAGLSNPPALSCTHGAAGCTCAGRTEDAPIDESVPYTATGSDLTFADFTATYCVDGDRLTLDLTPHPQSWRYWVLDRAP